MKLEASICELTMVRNYNEVICMSRINLCFIKYLLTERIWIVVE